MEREFLYDVMERMEFPVETINWIKMMYNGAKARIIVNGEMGEEINCERGIKQGCPLSMYLYIIYIEPLLQKLNTQLAGLTLHAQTTLRVCGYVDDIVICIEKETDFKIANNIIKEFENATNAKVNREKTKMMGFGGWNNRERWPFEWLKNEEKIKILGFFFHKTVEKTIAVNSKTCLEIIQNSVRSATGREMTALQRILFCNAFVVSKIVYISKVIPIDSKILKKCQRIMYRFVWGSKIEKLKQEEMYADIKEGGMGFVNISCKSKALFLESLIKTMCQESPIQRVVNYWVGQKMKFFKKLEPNKPYSETTPKIFLEPITNLKSIYLKDPSIDINKLKPKDLYYLLLLPETETPKALIKNPNITKESCMNLKSLKCNPRIKQHIFHQINDILPTNERLHKCKQTNSPICNRCPMTDNILHLYQCPPNQKAMDWLAAEIKKIEPSLNQIPLKNITVLSFKLTPGTGTRRKTRALTQLVSHFSYALWKSRDEERQPSEYCIAKTKSLLKL